MEATRNNGNDADAGSSPPPIVYVPLQWNIIAQKSSIVANAIDRLTLGGPTTMDRDVAAWNELAIDDCSNDDDDDDSIISIGDSSLESKRGDDRSSSSLSSTSHSSDDLFFVDEPDPTSIGVNNDTTSSKKGTASAKSSRKKKKSKKAKLPANQQTLRGFVSSNNISWSDDDKGDDGAKSDGSNWSDDMGRPKKKTTKRKKTKAAASTSAKKKKASDAAKSGQKRLSAFGIPKTSKSSASNSPSSGQGKKPYAIDSLVVLRNLTFNDMVDLNGKHGIVKSEMNDGKQDVDVNGQIMSLHLDNLRGVCPLFLPK